MKVYKPTDKVKKVSSVFLAGTIDMGKSVDWQAQLTKLLENYDIDVFNPRRDDWDSSWTQSMDNPQFNHQVSWELTCLKKADLVVMYFAPNSASVISLLELGLFHQKVICYCPGEFYRKGNVDVTGRDFGFPIYSDILDFVLAVKQRLEEEI